MYRDTITEKDDQFTNNSNVQTQTPVTHHTTLFINISNRITIK